MSSDRPVTDLPGSLGGYAGKQQETAEQMRDRLAEDVSGLRADMTKMHDILSKFVSDAGSQAAQTARHVGQTVASHVGSTATGLASTGADIASSATEQLKKFATDLEGIARKNPLGALVGALGVGIVIGLIVRGRR
jgi:ElaB/YqjD/DUF883 family membrane-anchored ribosome-binding protein